MLKFRIHLLTCLFLLLVSQSVFAQCIGTGSNLIAPYNSNTSNKGVMFNITATNTITISCFDANLPTLSLGTYAVYYKLGSYVGSEITPANWILVGTSGSILSLGINSPTAIDVPVNLTIPAGQTVAFYIGATNPATSTGFLTTTSAGFGTIASNINLTIAGGIGITYPFGTVTANRNFNGTVHYTLGTPTPVEFIDFTATKINQLVLLEWETESEINSDFFEIERSQDALNWNKLLKTLAAGESTEPKEYRELDLEPLQGISYYRLSQFDFDGTRTVLKTVSFNNELNLGINKIRVFPNPATEKVRVYGNPSELKEFIVLNQLGQDVTKQLDINSFDDYLVINFNNQQKGIFILKCKTLAKILIKE